MSLKLSIPIRAPVVLGENFTATVQLAPDFNVLGLMGHVLVYPKSLGLLVMLAILSAVL